MAGVDGAGSVKACVMRATRLAANGTTPAGATNSIVTAGLISLQASPVYDSGEDVVQKNGCGNISLSYKDPDRLKRWDLVIGLTVPDPEQAELLANFSLITTNGRSQGASVPAVGTDPGNGVCLEFWSKRWLGGGVPPSAVFTDGSTTSSSTTLTSATAAFTSADEGRTISGTGIPANTTILTVSSSTSIVLSAAATATATGVTITIGRPGQYLRWVFPKFTGKLDNFTLENAPAMFNYSGPAEENRGIGNGPNNDFPATANGWRSMSFFDDSTIPTPSLGYVSTPAQV